MNRTASVVLVVWSAAAPALLAQDAVVSHEVVTDDAKVGLGFFSSTEPRPNKNFLHVDDFTLGAAASIGSVAWWGQSTNDVNAGLENFASFTVGFYHSRTTAGGELRPERNPFVSFIIGLDGIEAEATGRVATHGGLEHRFAADLADAVELEAETIYFFSVAVTHVDPALDAFQWSDAELDNGYAGSWSYERTRWEMLQDTDSAFQLISVPAPAGLGVMSAALVMLSRRGR